MHHIALSVSLNDDEYQVLSALAEKNQVSMAWLCRRAIIELLEKYNQEQLQLPLGITKNNVEK